MAMAKHQSLVNFARKQFFKLTDQNGRDQINKFTRDGWTVLSEENTRATIRAWATNNEHKHGVERDQLEKEINSAIKSIRFVQEIVNAPGQPRLFTRGHTTCLNVWRQHAIADVKPSDQMPPVFEEFISGLIPDKSEREHVLKWLAILTRRPATNMRHGLILRSELHGVGKDLLTEKIIGECLLGRAHYAGVSLSDVKGQFNQSFAMKRLISIRELYRSQGTNSANALKALVTSEVVRVEEKYQPAYQADVFAGYIITSNERVPMVLESNDRRWFVPDLLQMPYEGNSEVTAMKFKNLVDAFETGSAARELAAYFEFLVQRMGEAEIQHFVSRPPVTRGKQELFEEDRRREQVDTLRFILRTGRKVFAFKIEGIMATLRRDPMNSLDKRDVTEALKAEGFSSKAVRLSGGVERAWAHRAFGEVGRTLYLDGFRGFQSVLDGLKARDPFFEDEEDDETKDDVRQEDAV